MAELVSDVIQVEPDSGIAKILNNPMFEDLQNTLIDDLNLVAAPFTSYSLGQIADGDAEEVHEAKSEPNPSPDATALPSNLQVYSDSEKQEKFDLIVEDATLQAEFKQLAPMCNEKVQELEQFYNTQCTEIATQRSDSFARIKSSTTDPLKCKDESLAAAAFFDKQQEHLVLRVSKSLQLLKNALPTSVPYQTTVVTDKPKKTRMLRPEAVAIMKNWFEAHIDYPYPTEEEKQELADQGGITLAQVKAWFANKRNRSLNTKPKRQKAKLANELSNICQKLAQAKQMGGDLHGAKSYNMILNELSSMIEVKPARSRFPLSNLQLAGQGQSPLCQGQSSMGHGQESPYPYYMSYNYIG